MSSNQDPDFEAIERELILHPRTSFTPAGLTPAEVWGGLEPSFFEDVEKRFALQRKPFVTLSDVLDQLTERLRGQFREKVGPCDLTIVEEVDNETVFKIILGYDKTKVKRIFNAMSDPDKVNFSEKEARSICEGKCGCEIQDCSHEHEKREPGHIEEKCVKIIGNSINGSIEWAQFVAAIFQIIFSGRNILPGVPGRVYEDIVLPCDKSTLKSGESSIVEIVDDNEEEGSLPSIRVFDLKEKEVTSNLASGEEESNGKLSQAINTEQRHWKKNHILYEWIYTIQNPEKSFSWNAYIPIQGLVPFRGYVSIPCASRSVSSEVIKYLDKNVKL
jgi:hypothetical protein